MPDLPFTAAPRDPVRIGLVSISDRASSGAYEDKGLPALQEWFGAALASPWKMVTRLIPDELPVIELNEVAHLGTRPHRKPPPERALFKEHEFLIDPLQ